MNILFISQLYHKDLLEEYAANTIAALDYAANNLGRAILKGFDENNVNIDVLNIPLIGSYPLYYKKLFVKGCKQEHFESVPYFNLMYVKRGIIRRKVNRRIEQWCETTEGEKILFFYSYTFLPIIEQLKKKYNVKVFVLAADLPEYMATDNGFVTRLNKMLGGNKSASGSYYDYVDGYVLLADAMRERLPVGNKPYIVVEGIYNPEDDNVQVEKEKSKTILYTGDLGRRYGIVDLLEAFHDIENKDYRLWICGKGDGQEDVEKYATIDDRIKYFGVLPRKQIIEKQKKATLLVNPRKSDQEYTKYSFPSKTMEYMASGTPVLMSHLQCIPKEYDEHLYYFEDETIEGLKNALVSICSKSSAELDDKGNRASQFIFSNKMPKAQVGRIIQFFTE